jgi:hypothetical protein
VYTKAVAVKTLVVDFPSLQWFQETGRALTGLAFSSSLHTQTIQSLLIAAQARLLLFTEQEVVLNVSQGTLSVCPTRAENLRFYHLFTLNKRECFKQAFRL